MHEGDGFLAKPFGKSLRVKMTAPAMAWPVTSDTGKTPAEYHVFLPPSHSKFSSTPTPGL